MGGEQSGPPGTESALRRFVVVIRSHPAVSFGVLLCLGVVGYVAISTLWPSDTARTKAALNAVVNAMKRGDTEAVLVHVSPYFSEEGMDKQALGRTLRRVLGTRPLVRANLSVRQLVVAGTRATLRVNVASYHDGAIGGRAARSEWMVAFEEIDGHWLVREATPLEVNERKVAGLRAVLAMGS